VALTLPFERALNLGGRWVAARPGHEQIGIMNDTYVTSGYFETLRIPLVRGRSIDARDSSTSEPVIVVNQAFVHRYSPDEDPIGRQIAMGGPPRRVIGVVGDVQQKSSWDVRRLGPVNATPASYVPASQASDGMIKMVHAWFSPSWIVRSAVAAPEAGRAIERAVHTVDPLLPVARFRTIDEVRGEAVAAERAQSVLLGALAGLALLLAAVGLYGLVASSVVERTKELGIRIALGATPRQAVMAAAVPGLLFGGAGLAAGLVLARLASTAVTSLVWGVSSSDPVTYAAAAGTMLLVSAVASLVPALRILRMNPVRSLRC